jgi:hypothetical protein
MTEAPTAEEPTAEEPDTVRSKPARVLVSVAAVLVAVAVVVHLAMMFLWVAPTNVLSRQYSSTVKGYVQPEFIQNWKLFAPEPLHTNVRVEARAELRDGGTSEWINVSAPDIDDTRYNVVPSHTRNQLRKGWRMFAQTHDNSNRAKNTTGWLLETYLKRTALMRLSEQLPADSIARVQLRSASTRVAEPTWSGRTTVPGTTYRVLPWWPVDAGDFPEGSRQ